MSRSSTRNVMSRVLTAIGITAILLAVIAVPTARACSTVCDNGCFDSDAPACLGGCHTTGMYCGSGEPCTCELDHVGTGCNCKNPI